MVSPSLKIIVSLGLLTTCYSSFAADKASVGGLLKLSLEELTELEIVTASKAPEKIYETPSTVIVITAEQILTRRYINLVDLLEDLPGVDVQRAVEDSRYHNITIHGNQGNNKFLILQDGIRIDSPTGEVIPIADNFPLYHAKQVEILYGPAAALYGADAFGGVINIITAEGKSIEGVRANVTAGEGNYRRYSVHAGASNEKIDFVAGAHWQKSDNADLAADYPNAYSPKAITSGGKTLISADNRESYQADTKSNSAFAKATLYKDFTIGFNHSYFQHLTSTGQRPETVIFDEANQMNTELNSLYGRFHHDWGSGWTSDTLLTYSTFELDADSRFANTFTSFLPGYKYSEGDKWGIEQQVSYAINANHRLVGGISYDDYYSLPRTPDLPAPYNTDKGTENQGYYYPNTNNSIPIRIFDADYTNKAMYLQWQATWNERWSSNLGVRYDKNSRYKGTVNPRLGLVYRPQTNFTVKALYGEAFRAPSVFENYATFGSFTGQQTADGRYISTSFRAPNPNLEPEKSRDFELSFDYRPVKNLQLGLATYYAEIENIIRTRTTDSPVQFLPGAYLTTTTIRDNLGTEKHYGADLSLNYQMDLGNGWNGDLWSSYSYLDGETCCDNVARDLPYVAKHKAKLGMTFSYQNRYFITPKVYWVGRTNTNKNVSSTSTERQQSPSYVVANLHLGARNFLGGLSANIDVYNLFNREYYNAGGESSTAFIATPQPLRTIMFSISYDY